MADLPLLACPQCAQRFARGVDLATHLHEDHAWPEMPAVDTALEIEAHRLD